MNFRILIPIMLCTASTSLWAASTSTNYTIPSSSVDSGGGQSSNGHYAMTSSVGGLGGLSGAASPEAIARAGYPGQLYEIVSLDVSTTPGSVSEGNSSQLSATINLDDGTVILPISTNVQWSQVSGPANIPSSSGLVSTQPVFQNSIATLGGTYAGQYGTGILTVLNTNPDNYDTYGADGVDDDWQVVNFGMPPNSDADPSANPDGDADDNLMEFLTGFDPTDPSQWFQLVITGQSESTATLQMNKVIPDRTYTIQAGTDLQNFDETVMTLNPDDEDYDVTVDDTNATQQKKFYRVDVTKR